MKTIIYFIRHAESNYNNHDDFSRELTDKGKADCSLVTEYLSDKKIDIVLSSPYKRAVNTVSDFANTHNLPIIRIDDFRERKIDNAWIEDFDAFTKKQWSDFKYKLSDGESLEEVQARNICALNNVIENFDGKRVVVGSHGTALSMVINYFYPLYGYEDFKNMKKLMPWIVKFEFNNKKCVLIETIDILNDGKSNIYSVDPASYI